MKSEKKSINFSYVDKLILNSKIFKSEVILCTIIIALPFLFFIYNFAPKDSLIWDLYLFQINAGVFEYVNYFTWIISYKLLIISVNSLWFITSRYSWRYILFIPIGIEIYRLVNLISYSFENNTDYQILLPIFLSITYFYIIIFFSKKFNFYRSHKDVIHVLNSDIMTISQSLSKFNTKDYKAIKKEMGYLIKEKETMSKKEYLAKLIALRDQLSVD
ncbi:hypothetical protein FBALC1_09247 [Flavobacteriales bacterium ALC-1]|nr:hypothetical protein FBALC1_09247 [Flavobacteriales bacterium ALC-1]